MKWRCVLLLPVVCLIAADAPSDDVKKAKEKLHATWAFVSAEVNGQKAPEGDIKDFKLIVAGDQFTFKINGDIKATLKTVDPATNPTIIDLEFTEGPIKGALEGIYQVEGDTLKLCVCLLPGAKQRPGEFATKEGSNLFLVVLKRETR
jgi:uncharacterized protein (TIGR03067 family)